MTVNDWIASVSVFVSCLALAISYIAYRGTLRAAIKPVLIFSMSTDVRWQVQNVGTGPAINVMVVDRHDDGSTDSAANCHPLAAGAHHDLPWLKAGHELIAIYRDTFGTTFTTVCKVNTNTVRAGNAFPDVHADTHQWIEENLIRAYEYSSLQEQDLEEKSSWELDVMRFEPYARRGCIFQRPDLDEHFREQPWYNPVTDNVRKVYRELSDEERVLVLFIKAHQSKRWMRALHSSC